jgi:integrase
LDGTLDGAYRNEIAIHCRYIKRKWGALKPFELRKNAIEAALKERHGTNNTRNKYATFIRMFFNWVLHEDRQYIQTNPAAGIRFRSEGFEKEFYPLETLRGLLRFIVEEHKSLLGYYAILTFAGLRPSEGARVTWNHLNFSTGELHVVKGKTLARHIKLEPVAIEWMRFYRANTPQDHPFVPTKNLANLEKQVRAHLRGKWIPDGLRHGFATNFASLKKDFPMVAFYMGNSVGTIKKHYAQTVPTEQLNEFWSLTPAKVLDPAPPDTAPGAPGSTVAQAGSPPPQPT